ncbi:MAG: TIR domain-containing protein [Calditrichaeota bacterium]|jgi:hypothetical protein|nr:TIR domain-containing protein [Calditrichota bacterium]MBT7789665.1 TIR domain-containing protein [Calditrichota bacterium]
MQIFLSFAFDEDIDQVNGFRGMLENPNADINFVDGSCKKDYAGKSETEIKTYIKSLLDQSSVTVCLISKDTKNKEWVDWELEASQSKGKGIVGIVLKGKSDEIKHRTDCPDVLGSNKYEVIYWTDAQKMQSAIEQAEKARR